MGVSDFVLPFTTQMEEVSVKKIAIATINKVQALAFCANNFIFECTTFEVFPFISSAFAALDRRTNSS